MATGIGRRTGHAIVPSDWAAFFNETHVPAAIRVDDTLHVTGTTGETAYETFPEDPEAQVRQTFTNIALTLAEAGATWSDVVSMTTYHVGLSSQATMLLRVASDFLQAPYPAWTAVGVSELWSRGAIIEISCVAILGREDDGEMRPRVTDEESIRTIAAAYLESWLDGDGERMRGALHPDLAKRGLDYAADRTPSGVHHLTAEYMERSAAKGPRPQFERTCEITVLDIADSIASAKVVSEPFVDYLHLAKLDGRWSIVNVLYEDRANG